MRETASILAASSVWAIRCTRAGASLARIPWSNGSNGTSRCASCRFNHSCPFRQSFAGEGK